MCLHRSENFIFNILFNPPKNPRDRSAASVILISQTRKLSLERLSLCKTARLISSQAGFEEGSPRVL